MSSDTPVKLRIPRQDLQDFDFFALTAEAARQWASALPVTSSSQTAQQLHTVVSRLNRVELTPELRFNIMEELRPALLVAVASLSRRFLKQPLVLADEPRQMAELADNLHALAGVGYTIVAVHALQRRESIREVNAARLVCESIHRAIRFAGARLLQAFQLYRPVELRGWLGLHQLYALAEGQQLTQLNVEDELSGTGTIATAYLQVLMLGCCKPNQLRQADLTAIYRGLQEWCALLQVSHAADQKSQFLTDLDSDLPALYSQLYHEPPGPRTRYIDTEPLVEHLRKLASPADKRGVVFDKDTVVSPALLDHLITSFSKMSMRNFTRKRVGKPMWVGLGLSTCHYQLAGEQNFEQVLHGADYIPPPEERLGGNPFLERQASSDLWQKANPEEDFTRDSYALGDDALAHEVQLDPATRAALEDRDEPEELADRQRYQAHSVTMFDASPGGYCLEWTEELPDNIKTGDIVCVREEESPRWAVAAIRWMSRLDNSMTLIGLELLSPGAKPYGACMQQQKKGEQTEPMRVLLLPGIKLIGQPSTLITPRAGFRERQKIILLRHGEEFFIQLMRQVAITGAFVQFEFRYIKQLGEVLAEDKTRPRDTGFDSLWTNI
jgi:hypothetical protein